MISKDLAELGVTEEQFIQFIEEGAVEPEFEIKVPDGSSMDFMNGYHVDDALDELMNSECFYQRRRGLDHRKKRICRNRTNYYGRGRGITIYITFFL